jgi:hypothetical protein
MFLLIDQALQWEKLQTERMTSVQVSNVELLHLLTTRMCNCTECQKHSVQAKNHSVQIVPSVTLGIKHSVNGDSAQFVLALSIGKTLGVVYLYRVFPRHSAQCHTRYKSFHDERM